MKTRRFLSYGSLRALAASTRRGQLAGGIGSTIIDRDLDRVALDLLTLSQAEPRSRIVRTPRGTEHLDPPVALHERRVRSVEPTAPVPSATRPHARAS